jgi:tetratricopeptide (TPR) repeat protein
MSVSKRNRSSLWFFLGGTGLLLLVLAGGAVGVYLLNRKPPTEGLPPRPKESSEARQREVVEAFRGPVILPDGWSAAELQAYFETFGAALRDGNRLNVVGRFDLDRVSAEIGRLGRMPRGSASEQDRYKTGLRLLLTFGVQQEAALVSWDWTQVRRAVLDADGTEALVYAVHRDERGPRLRMRWWLTHRPDGWRAYDFEDLDGGFRFSDALASLPAETVMEITTPSKRVLAVCSTWFVGRAIALQEPEVRAARSVAPDLGHLSDGMQARAHLLQAATELEGGRPENALRHLDQADEQEPGLPAVHYLRACTANRVGEPHEALRHASRYLDLIGNDADGHRQIALALVALHRTEEALEACREGLQECPGHPGLMNQFRRTLPAGRKAEFAELFATTPDQRGRLEPLVRTALDEGDLAGAEALLEGYRPQAAGDPQLPLLAALLRMRQRRFAEASGLMHEGLVAEPDAGRRGRFTVEFLTAMQGAGRLMDGYHAVPDAAVAFRFLVGQLVDDGPDDPGSLEELLVYESLRLLVTAHRARAPDDPWLPFYAGRLAEHDGDLAEAERQYALGMALDLDEATRERYRAARVDALYRAGRGLEAYRLVGPPRATFRQLIPFFVDDPDPVPLTKLAEAHVRADPTDPDRSTWQAEICWRRGDYEGVASLLKRGDWRAQNSAAETPGYFEKRNQLRRDRLVRSLLRLGRLDEAEEEIEPKSYGELWALGEALVAAAQGDAKGVFTSVESIIKDAGPDALVRLYSDADLGPLLDGPAGRLVREKYPPPVERLTTPPQPTP